MSNDLPAARGIGYKHPPANRRFAKGSSGNRRGRPRGTPNEADILQRLLNKKVRVRDGTRRRKMTMVEAIIRYLLIKARSGDARSLDTVIWLHEKFAVTDVTSEAREKRTVKLPRSYTKDEFDLLNAPAREKERQHFRAILDRQARAFKAETTAPTIQIGDGFVDQGKHHDALVAYCRQIAICEKQIADDANNDVAKKELARAIARIGLLADQRLFAGDFAMALKCANQAMAHGADTDLTWIALIRTHANMLLGNTGEARKFYCSHQSDKRITLTSWETLILQNFEQLRKAGHQHPLMTEMEQKLFDAGWTAQGRRSIKLTLPEMSYDEQYSVIMNPNDVKTAALLEKYGKLDEAANILRHNVAICQTKLAIEPRHAETRKSLDLVVQQFGLLAEKFVDLGRFPTALDCVHDLIALAPERYELQAIRADALMFIGQPDEAKDLYLRHRGKKIGEVSWECAVLAHFEKFRRAGRSHPLMDEIAALFSTESRSHAPENISLQTDMHVAEINVLQADDIGSADRLFTQGRIDEGVEVLRRRIKICQGKLTNGRTNMQALQDRQIAVDLVSDVAFHFILKHDFPKAIDLTDEALKVLENSGWAKLRRGHTLMMLGRADEARSIYQGYLSGKATPEQTWQSVVRDEFAMMREHGLAHDLMDEIEKGLTNQA